ncbi:MAG: CoA-binding protein [Saprospiraceae bacterium]|nr:CoA-binding protein [Saprospiraceae bacterium]
MKKTLIIGASTNPERTAYTAIQRLVKAGHEVIAVGTKSGEVAGVTIHTQAPEIGDVNTVSLYVNPDIQQTYYDYLLHLKPKRILFNPGTENPQFAHQAQLQGIETEFACTLVLLATGTY